WQVLRFKTEPYWPGYPSQRLPSRRSSVAGFECNRFEMNDALNKNVVRPRPPHCPYGFRHENRCAGPDAIAPPDKGSATMPTAIGSVFMTAISFATAVMPLGTAIVLFSALAHGRMIVMLLLLLETRGRAIATIEVETPSPAAYLSQPAARRT